MLTINESFEKIQSKGIGEFFTELFPKANIKKVGSSYRINPCFNHNCRHNDCMTASGNFPGCNCFSCGTTMNYYQVAKYALGNVNNAIKFIENFIGEKIQFSKEDEKTSRIYDIRLAAAKHYHSKLIADKEYYTYQTDIRKHTDENIRRYMIGKAEGYIELHNFLLAEGYKNEEIKEARIWIPEGLVVHPYFNTMNNVEKFNTKNPFEIKDNNGKVVAGYCTGPKTFFTSLNVKQYYIIVCEGEHDALSLIEAGVDSVVATGGTPSHEQIEQLRRFNKVYCMFDNDDAGIKDTIQVNEILPDVKVFEIKYDQKYKDPDEYYKNNPNPQSIEELMRNAVELVNNKYVINIENDELNLKNRKFALKYKIKEKDNKGNFKGDFVFYNGDVQEEIKLNTSIDKIGKKYIQFVQPINDALTKHYNDGLEDKSYNELLKLYNFSSRKTDIISLISIRISEIKEPKEKQIVIEYIETHCSQHIKDSILRELNNAENKNLDPDINYPFMPASQAYDLNNNRAYMYFNMSIKDDDGIKIVPALLSSDKRVLRLDYYRRKSTQHLLLVDEGAFQLHEEVPNAIMSTEVCSLKSKFARKYIDNSISNDEVKPIIILKEMEEYFRKIYYTEDEIIYKMLSLFAYSTYFYQLFGVTPYLFLNAQKGSGKSLLASLLSKLCFCCRYTVGTTEAALFRTISSCGGTIILDEMENLTSRDKTADSLMASILKSGYAKNTGNTLRTNTETKSVEEFSLFAPKIISNIYGIEDVVEDRCIKVPMKKYPSNITNKMLDVKVFENNYRDKIEETSSKACISALVNFQDIYNKYVSTQLDMGSARNSQIMRPILTLASVAGEEYSKAVLGYYQKYIEKDKKWVESHSPEGCLKETFSIIAEAVHSGSLEWLDKESLTDYCKEIDLEKFAVNTFVIKLMLDQIDGQKSYSMTEVHKLIKRVYPGMELKTRTSISITSNENWVKIMRNQTKIAVYVLTVKYDDFIVNSEKLEDNLL